MRQLTIKNSIYKFKQYLNFSLSNKMPLPSWVFLCNFRMEKRSRHSIVSMCHIYPPWRRLLTGPHIVPHGEERTCFFTLSSWDCTLLYTHVMHSSIQMKELEITAFFNDMLNTTLEKKERKYSNNLSICFSVFLIQLI